MRVLILRTSSGIHMNCKLERRAANGSLSGNATCGTTYRRVIDEHAASSNPSSTSRRAKSQHLQSPDSDDSIYDEMQHYTRLRILARTFLPAVEVGGSLPDVPSSPRRPHTRFRSPRGLASPSKVWRCGHCGMGLMSTLYNASCTSCGRHKDSYALEYY